jgi:hypothetical protein
LFTHASGKRRVDGGLPEFRLLLELLLQEIRVVEEKALRGEVEVFLRFLLFLLERF